MLRGLTTVCFQTRGVKQLVNVKWVKPEYVPAYKPQKSGDLENLPNISQSSIPEDYALSEHLKDAPETVKQLFSVAHLGKKEYNALVKKELMDRVRKHKYDDDTPETKIAKLTGHIRCLQDTMEQFPRNIKTKVCVQELIDKRKKLLKFLRQYDYKKFEWLLEKLNIEYKAHPEDPHKLTRKESLRKLTEMHCDEIRNNKLADYRNLLESQQGPFLENKLKALKFIRNEQIELKLSITVTEQDISKVEKQLDDWKIRNEQKQELKKKKKKLI
ncbi:28S ribosomal protein S15, mitochondrial [Leptidea sinapis]|uniref:Small ribosomal subunit protein uS15m n=1 Tax=Leptidea sinapis TaxID=189913 RepID=A0A5E4QC65_9NEOP|nr:28S ribosomal protein S15, mitochondrial [Leptidea sinapis]VVC95878.1 unnamed protein product [Leptidea sinapis]